MGKVLQTAGKVAKTTLRWIPPINAVCFLNSQLKLNSDVRNPVKYAGHLIYAFIGANAIAFWGLAAYSTGEINPVRARQVMVQRIEQAEAEKSNYQKQVSDLSERIFSGYGLADTNKDGVVDFTERAEAYRKMGLESQVQFPKPNLEQLEKAVQSYQHR